MWTLPSREGLRTDAIKLHYGKFRSLTKSQDIPATAAFWPKYVSCKPSRFATLNVWTTPSTNQIQVEVVLYGAKIKLMAWHYSEDNFLLLYAKSLFIGPMWVIKLAALAWIRWYTRQKWPWQLLSVIRPFYRAKLHSSVRYRFFWRQRTSCICVQ